MRYLYSDVFSNFLRKDSEAIFAELVDNYHGEIIGTTKEAWKSEIALLKNVLVPWSNENSQIIFENNIPRLTICRHLRKYIMVVWRKTFFAY